MKSTFVFLGAVKVSLGWEYASRSSVSKFLRRCFSDMFTIFLLVFFLMRRHIRVVIAGWASKGSEKRVVHELNFFKLLLKRVRNKCLNRILVFGNNF